MIVGLTPNHKYIYNKCNWKLVGLQRAEYGAITIYYYFFFFLLWFILSNDFVVGDEIAHVTLSTQVQNKIVYLVNGTMSSVAKEIQVWHYNIISICICYTAILDNVVMSPTHTNI
jgi:hypothetical protein